MPETPTTALYVHWPFCLHKCPYCDFNSHVREGIDAKRWQHAYLTELRHHRDYLKGKRITSVFFGGGTPTLMPPSIAESILNELANISTIDSSIEVTLEGNPTSVEAQKLADFKAAGINRVSLGVQALDDNALHFLGREHSAAEALKAVETAATLFPRYSFDLIYARPEHTFTSWEKELKQALYYARGHLSLYQLTIEKGTLFYARYSKGGFTLPNEQMSAELYTLTEEIMRQAGIPAYEVSNYAAPGQECLHNLTYWHYRDYLGIGAGAHSRITEHGTTRALMTLHSPEAWIESVEKQNHGVQTSAVLSEEEKCSEWLLMRLRLTEGIAHTRLKTRLNLETEAYETMLKPLQEEGLIDSNCDTFLPTLQGRLVLNALVQHVLKNVKTIG